MPNICEDCEQAPAVAVRVCKDDGLPLHVCQECDPGTGCRPVVVRDTYSNGSPKFSALCRICGWESEGSASSEDTARRMAQVHAA